jgi:TolB protein
MRTRTATLLAAAITAIGTLAGVTAPAAHATFKTEPRLTFIRCEPVSCNLFTMKLDGSNQRRVTNLPSGKYVEFGHISPDGSMVVMSIYNGSQSDIWTANIDGSHMRDITKTSSDEYDPSFSPDGMTVIYIRLPNAGVNRIETRNVNGTGRKVVLKNDGVDEPAFSPDGTQIATSAYPKGSADEEIFVMSANGTHLQRLTHNVGDDWMGTWSPDGTHLSWYRYTGSDGDVFTMKANGRHVHQLTTTSTIDYAPWYTPNGKRIYYSDSISGTWHIYSIPASGGSAHQLTTSVYDDYVISS